MKLNHFICPNCGHDWYEDCSYGTCDKCQTFFYLSRTYGTGKSWMDFTRIGSAQGFQPLDLTGIQLGSTKGKITVSQ